MNRLFRDSFLFFSGYDGPLQYSMSRDNNPDQIISVLSNADHLESK